MKTIHILFYDILQVTYVQVAQLTQEEKRREFSNVFKHDVQSQTRAISGTRS